MGKFLETNHQHFLQIKKKKTDNLGRSVISKKIEPIRQNLPRAQDKIFSLLNSTKFLN